jgi:hypothetical protein
MRRAAPAPRTLGVAEPERPDEVLLVGEARDAMQAALARLPDQERRDLLAYYGDGASDAAEIRETRGALRVRMARTRAKLRLEYLLAFRHIELPYPTCRSVLLAISFGDTRRQRELNAGHHLLDCEVCAALSEPLDRRSAALTAIAIPGALAAWVAGKASAHPLQTAASVVAGGAAIAAAVVLGSQPAASRPAPPPVRISSVHAPSPVQVISHLTVGGQAVSDVSAARSLRSLVGRSARASGATVVAAVTANGFWIGSSQARVWVQLVGPLRPLRVRAGDRVRFTGIMVGNSSSFPAQTGARGSDAALLERQGAHLAVSTTNISVATDG